MGYGAGADIKLNCEYGYAIYNGKNLIIVVEDTPIDSWNFHDAMYGMSEIKPELLKIKFNAIKLTQEDRNWMKKDGYKKGERMYFTWYKKPEGMVWSGYVRSPINVAFPVDLTGNIDFGGGMGSFDVTVTVKPANLKEFEIFVEDVLEYIVSDENVEEFMKEEADNGVNEYDSEDEARQALYDIHEDNIRNDYGV